MQIFFQKKKKLKNCPPHIIFNVISVKLSTMQWCNRKSIEDCEAQTQLAELVFPHTCLYVSVPDNQVPRPTIKDAFHSTINMTEACQCQIIINLLGPVGLDCALPLFLICLHFFKAAALVYWSIKLCLQVEPLCQGSTSVTS